MSNITTPSAIQELETCMNNMKEHPELYIKISSITSNFKKINNIYNNKTLFMRCVCHSTSMYDTVGEALNAMTDTDILINFTNFDLYGLFTEGKYTSFITNIECHLSDKPETLKEQFLLDNLKTTKLYQIVLANKKQRFVFACKNEKHFDQLANYAKECFQKNIVMMSGNEITMDFEVGSTDEISDAFSKLEDFVEGKDETFTEYMKKIKIHKFLNIEYRKYSCTAAIDFKNPYTTNKDNPIIHITYNTTNNISNSNNTTKMIKQILKAKAEKNKASKA